jgi:glyoxylase-like metal-dependent hydrolase (beta-lactamase superfamily II)
MRIKRIIVGSLQTNCYIVSSDKKEAFIIDPGDDADAIREFINEDKLKVKFIINTHSHIDHIKADYELGFPVYIHELDALALEDPGQNFSTYILGEFKACKPGKILYDKDIIKLDDLHIEVLHTPGHTPGGICLKIDNVVFTGDTLFRDGIGRTDLPGGSHKTIISSIKNKLFCLDDEVKIYPGHGEFSTIGRERNNF